jgi:hypothetical protein
MQIQRPCGDPWTHVVTLLASGVRMGDVLRANRSVTPRHAISLNRSILTMQEEMRAVVRIRERTTSTTAKVEWCDPTLCRYGDQVWSASVARRDGLCALSGRIIRKGDLVYKPKRYGVAPANANAMIAASCVEGPLSKFEEAEKSSGRV